MHRRHACAALLAAAWGPSSTTAAAEPLRIVMAPKAPIGIVGMLVMKTLYAQLGVPVVFDPVPLPRMTQEVLQGKADGELQRVPAYFAANPQLIRVDPPFLDNEGTAYSLAERQLRIAKADDLAPLAVGVLRGNTFAENLAAGSAGVTRAQTAPQLLRMLQARRVDVVVLAGINGQYYIDQMGLRDIEPSPALVHEPLHHGLARPHAALAAKLGAAITRARASGELARLTAQALADLRAMDPRLLNDLND